MANAAFLQRQELLAYPIGVGEPIYFSKKSDPGRGMNLPAPL